MINAMLIVLFKYFKKLNIMLFIVLLSSCVNNVKDSDTDEYKNIIINEEYGVDEAITEKFNQAVKLIQEDKNEEAVKLLLEVTSNSKKHSAPYINLGIAYLKLGKVDESEEQLLKALAISPDHPVANNELGLVYRKSGRFAEAKKVYQHVVDQYPLFLPVRKNYGILCDLFMKDLHCAIEQYQAYLKQKPDNKEMKIWLTDLKRRAGVE